MPLASQLVIIAYTVQQGNWIMAVTGLPAMIGYLTTMLPDEHASPPYHESATRRIEDGKALGSETDSTTNVPATGLPTVDISTVDIPSDEHISDEAGLRNGQLYEELGLSVHGGHTRLWREIVGIWVCRSPTIMSGHCGGKTLPRSDVPLGISATSTLCVSLADDGPHALVAGTTGSGKSVLLQNWCLALAVKHPPSALNLVLLDFKGGAAFGMLAGLPHTVGCVSDLSLQQAIRALKGLECELKRREILLQQAGVSSYEELAAPPPRIVVVVDEFHALRQQLPGAEDRLGRIASLGRSLGMHIIVSTQNPLGQITSQIKANIALRICLRVQDPMQSIDVLGDSRAATISGRHPGYAYCLGSEGIRAFQSLSVDRPEELVRALNTACRFIREEGARPIFTPPLPRVLPLSILTQLHRKQSGNDEHPEFPRQRQTAPVSGTNSPESSSRCSVMIGLQDDGICLQPCTVSLNGENFAVVGQYGSGKSSLLALIQTELHKYSSSDVAAIFISKSCDVHDALQRVKHDTTPGSRSKLTVLLLDEVIGGSTGREDLANDELIAWALRSPDISVIATFESFRLLRRIEQFSLRIVFPTGEHSQDAFSGIPSALLKDMTSTDFGIPGRGFIVAHGKAQALQCATSTHH
jgi:S-DNA-T family DNA segregation ATPase FtsK/SpoIIIE